MCHCKIHLRYQLAKKWDMKGYYTGYKTCYCSEKELNLKTKQKTVAVKWKSGHKQNITNSDLRTLDCKVGTQHKLNLNNFGVTVSGLII